MPRGEKKTWQVESQMERTKTRGGGEVSSLVVTSTSETEEGRLDQVYICQLLCMLELVAICLHNLMSTREGFKYS